LHMGGGITSSEDDPLLRFKKTLSPARSTFWIGTHCHNESIYEELCRGWEARNGARPGNFFQFYRLPPALDT
jgi:hypothetical protein